MKLNLRIRKEDSITKERYYTIGEVVNILSPEYEGLRISKFTFWGGAQ
jgi:hypothetical protein